MLTSTASSPPAHRFCFTRGYTEVSVSLPGNNKVGGYWPGVWLMGNLGRPGCVSYKSFFGASRSLRLVLTRLLMSVFTAMVQRLRERGHTAMTAATSAPFPTRRSPTGVVRKPPSRPVRVVSTALATF